MRIFAWGTKRDNCIMIKFGIEVEVTDVITLQILVTIGSGVLGGAGVEFPTFPLTFVIVSTKTTYRPFKDGAPRARRIMQNGCKRTILGFSEKSE